MKTLNLNYSRKSKHSSKIRVLLSLVAFLISGHVMTLMAYPGCDDPAAANYDPAATSNNGSCEYAISSCGPDTYTYCYENNEFKRFYYEASSGSDLYVLLNSGQVQGGADFFFIWDNFEGIGSPLYTVSGPLHAGTILHSSTGELMVQVVSGPSVSCDSNGLDPLNYTIRCQPPAPNGDCSNASSLTVPDYPATANILENLWFVENSGDPVCTGNEGADLFYSFTLTAKNTAIVNVNPVGGADLVVQVLDGCAGTELACVDDNTSGGLESVLLEELEAGTYIVRVHNVSGDVETQSSGLFTINAQQLRFASVQDNPANPLYSCNQTDFQLESFLGATPQTTTGVIDYKWLVAEVDGGIVNEWQRGEPNYVTRCDWLGMDYGKTFNVFVKALWDHPVHGPIWSVYSGDYDNPYLPGSSSCTVSTSANITPTELRPNYTPTNAQGNNYGLCDFVLAYNVSNSENFRWRFDGNGIPGDIEDIIYTRGSGNPSVRLSWVDGLIPGLVYNVAVEVQVAGNWSGYSTVHPISLALPPNNVQLRSSSCGVTVAPNGYVLSETVCEADNYTFEFVPQGGGTTITFTSGNYVCFLNNLSPDVVPGTTYDVRVKVSQGGVAGDFGGVCEVTISGPTAPGSGMVAQRDMASSGSATLFPNPTAGEEVRVNLDGLSSGNHEVMIAVYDVHGKQIITEGFGHEGESLSRVLRFSDGLPTGMYLVQVVIDGESFTTERLVVK